MNVMTPLALVPRGGAGEPEPVAPVRGGAAEQVGEVTAAWQLSPGALLLVGWGHEPPPARGAARLGRRRADGGAFRSVAWPYAPEAPGGRSGASPHHAFAIALRLPGSVEPRAGQVLTLEPDPRDAGGASILAHLPEPVADPLELARAMARLAADAPMPLARFLADVLLQPATAGRPDVAALLGVFLGATAEPDGCVEMLAGVPGSCVALQGWGRAEEAVQDCLLVSDGRLRRERAQVATFERPDILPPCTGTVLVLPAEAAEALSARTAVFLLTGARPRRRDLVPEAAVLDAADSAAHLRALLPSLRCAPAVADCLRAAARPRFGGRDTLNMEGRPLRAAVDLAVRVPGGAYLHGWLLDPARLVATVTLRGTAGGAARLDATWTRIPRPDVSEAFRGLPGPAGAPAHAHGFAAHAPAFREPDGALFLELELRDGAVAFLPLEELDAADLSVPVRLFGTADLHKPSGLAVVERQLAPLFAGGIRPAANDRAAEVLCGADPGWTLAMVVALPARPALPRALLSQFLHDPLRADEGLVLACGDAWEDAHVQRLCAELRFRALPAMVLRVPGPSCAVAALAAAAALTAAPLLLSLGAGTHGRAPGWRVALRAALEAQPGLACASATELHEDFSLRFAGIEAARPLPHAPWFEVEQDLAGMPAALAAGADAVPVLSGSLSCCLLPRDALARLAPAPFRHATAEATELDFFLRLRAAGTAVLWLADAQVYALDAPPACEDGLGPNAEQVARLVDGWGLRAAWGGRLQSAGVGPGVAPGTARPAIVGATS